MTRLLKPVHKLSIGIIMLLIAVATSSFAEEIVVTTVITPIASGAPRYLFVSNSFHYRESIRTSTAPNYIPMVQFPWTAPETGQILVKWYYPTVWVFVPGNPSNPVGNGDLSFRVTLDGQPGPLNASRMISGLKRFLGASNRIEGDVQFPPIIDIFTVNENTTYSVGLEYMSINFTNFLASTAGNSSGGCMAEIKYVKGECINP